MSQSPSTTGPESRRGPLLDLLGMRPEVLAPGRVRVLYDVGPDHLRTRGIVHGGIIATLLDTALGVAASSVAPDDQDVVTAQINVNFLRPARQNERLEASGEVVHAGRKTAVATGQVLAASGALVATASATFLFVPAPDLFYKEARV